MQRFRFILEQRLKKVRTTYYQPQSEFKRIGLCITLIKESSSVIVLNESLCE